MEGYHRGGIVIANNMLYWRVIEGGLAGVAHKNGSTCPPAKIYNNTTAFPEIEYSLVENVPPGRSLSDYITLDLTTPATNPNPELVEQLKEQVTKIVDANNHLMPYFLERGFSSSVLWPYNTTNPPGLPYVQYINTGNVFWHDPGELIYTLAMAYPYLNTDLKTRVKNFVSAEMTRYPPLSPLPWTNTPWLKQGVAREGYEVPYRASLNNWPPPAPNFSVLYGLWLWSKNTGDWSYVQSRWTDIRNFFNTRKNDYPYYADISGAIGFTRIANQLGQTTDYQNGTQAALAGMQAGLDFNTYKTRAENDYDDPRGNPTGWNMPVFFGLTPEVGLYLKEQFSGSVESFILSKENGNGMRWWYITRVGQHAEPGETSYLLPTAAWSHFLAHAYVIRNKQSDLIKWLDRPWGRGDFYSIQKIVATLQANP
jgi:hypothetical protein